VIEISYKRKNNGVRSVSADIYSRESSLEAAHLAHRVGVGVETTAHAHATLRHDSHGSTGVGLGHSWEHHVHIHVEGSVHLLLSLLVFLLLDVLGSLLHHFDSGGEVLDELDEVRHDELL